MSLADQIVAASPTHELAIARLAAQLTVHQRMAEVHRERIRDLCAVVDGLLGPAAMRMAELSSRGESIDAQEIHLVWLAGKTLLEQARGADV